jgi:hypothetical protein
MGRTGQQWMTTMTQRRDVVIGSRVTDVQNGFKRHIVAENLSGLGHAAGNEAQNLAFGSRQAVGHPWKFLEMASQRRVKKRQGT